MFKLGDYVSLFEGLALVIVVSNDGYIARFKNGDCVRWFAKDNRFENLPDELAKEFASLAGDAVVDLHHDIRRRKRCGSHAARPPFRRAGHGAWRR